MKNTSYDKSENKKQVDAELQKPTGQNSLFEQLKSRLPNNEREDFPCFLLGYN